MFLLMPYLSNMEQREYTNAWHSSSQWDQAEKNKM